MGSCLGVKTRVGEDITFHSSETGVGPQLLLFWEVPAGPPNQAPTAVSDTEFTSTETPVIFDVTDNDTDPDGDTLTVIDVASPTNGDVTINSDGTLTYTPE